MDEVCAERYLIRAAYTIRIHVTSCGVRNRRSGRKNTKKKTNEREKKDEKKNTEEHNTQQKRKRVDYKIQRAERTLERRQAAPSEPYLPA